MSEVQIIITPDLNSKSVEIQTKVGLPISAEDTICLTALTELISNQIDSNIDIARSIARSIVAVSESGTYERIIDEDEDEDEDE